MANTGLAGDQKRGKVKGLQWPWGHHNAPSPVRLSVEVSGIPGWCDGGGASP